MADKTTDHSQSFPLDFGTWIYNISLSWVTDPLELAANKHRLDRVIGDEILRQAKEASSNGWVLMVMVETEEITEDHDPRLIGKVHTKVLEVRQDG